MKVKTLLSEKLGVFFQPRSIAVVGASNSPGSMGTKFLEALVEFGYQGGLYPVHPKAETILGIQGYPSLKDIPGDVDYVISSISARQVPEMLRQCPDKNVKMVHLFTARMAETGDPEGQKLEQEIADMAIKLGIPLLGPNCMGLYNPGAGISFSSDLPKRSGPVGGLFQSGAAAATYARLCGLKGIGFSRIVSYGNAVDINECDLLEYFASDQETKVIAVYIEGVRDGRRFISTLRQAAQVKPVILLKGGRSRAGTRSTSSHTGSIAGSSDAWEVIYNQCNVVKVSDMSEFIDQTVAFSFFPPITGKRVGVFGGSGGKMVMSADECEQSGLDVVPLPEEIREFVGQNDPYLRDWLGNPLDCSITAGAATSMVELLKVFLGSAAFDVVIYNVAEDYPFGGPTVEDIAKRETAELIKLYPGTNKPVAVYMSNPEVGASQIGEYRYRLLFDLRETLAVSGLPVFSTTRGVAAAISKLVDYYRKKSRLLTGE
ncbi:MAG: acetate--CoA ligase family protein [Bacillota bacterium]